ncbi:MAG TPA: phosphoribosylglycinamide synthetase C domain-containing protein [Chloroflexaceae bacterium]|nr:phosphoribosylglycinamide synthetase C domain-containing protein [Chloroflexaceae bacterium]
MKILVLGGDSRAHALVWKLFNSAAADLLVAPGNGGSALLAPVVPVAPGDPVEVARWAFDQGVDLIVPAESGPLAAGLVDEVIAMHIGVCGPPRRAARLEHSRCFARAFLERHGLPLPRGRVCADLATAEKYLAARQLPVAIRADSLEGGAGVYHDRYAALEALRAAFAERPVEGASAGVVIEEHLLGARVSFTAITDGSAAVPLLPARTYDTLGPEPDSPAAPGMGAITGNSAYARKLGEFLHTRVVLPIVAALGREGLPYWGFLGVDCVITEQGPRVEGLRCGLRVGEAEAVLPRLEDDLLPLIEAAITRRLDRAPAPRWRDEASVALGLVAQGYPHHSPYGAAVQGLSEMDQGVLVFHDQTHNPAGLRYSPAAGGGGLAGLLAAPQPGLGAVTVTGGRVATVVAMGATLAGARGRALLNAERVGFPGRIYSEHVGAHEFK